MITLILLIFFLNVNARQVVSVCQKKCESVKGYLVITDKNIHIRINGTETFEIERKVKTRWKVFYKLKNGWIVVGDNVAIMEIGGEVTKYKFKYIPPLE